MNTFPTLFQIKHTKYHHYWKMQICSLESNNLKTGNTEHYFINFWRNTWLNIRRESGLSWLSHGVFLVKIFKVQKNLSLTSHSSLSPIYSVTNLMHRSLHRHEYHKSYPVNAEVPFYNYAWDCRVQMVRAPKQVSKGLLSSHFIYPVL